MKKDQLILVTGATGKQGGAVARHLLQAGFRVRGLTRNPNQQRVRQLQELGAEMMAGNLDDHLSLEKAVKGVYGVFSVQNYWEKGVGYEGEIRQGRNLADAAKAAGVTHFVQSTMAAAESFRGVAHFASKAEVEKYIDQVGLPRTLIGTVYFMDNLLDPKMGGSMTFPVLSGSLKESTLFHMVAVEDIGAATARVFQQPEQFIGQRIDVAGDCLTIKQMKEVYTHATGKKPKSFRIPAWLMHLLNKEFAGQLQWHSQVGWRFSPPATKLMLPALTTFEQFLQKHKVTNL